MTVIFRAKTSQGYVLKVLAELLQNNIKTACFEVDEKTISLRMMDHHKTILIDLSLDSTNFEIFICKEKLHLGINLIHFHKMLKSIKKKDSIELFIDDSSINDLGIKVMPEKNNRITTSFIKIQNIQTLDIDIPSNYDKPVLVPSSEFQKMCKGLTHISNITHISSKGFLIRFSTDAGGVMKRYTEFGEKDEDEKSEDEETYSEEFDTEQLTRITKLSGLNSTIQIFPKRENPLLFRTQIGSLGKISIFIKSKNQQQKDSESIESDCE